MQCRMDDTKLISNNNRNKSTNYLLYCLISYIEVGPLCLLKNNKKTSSNVLYELYKGYSNLPEGVVEDSVDIGECWIVEEFTGLFPVVEIRPVTQLVQ